MGTAVTRAAVAAVAVRPSLWLTAAQVGARLVPRGWWHRPPFLPRPDPAYVGFRAVTQYGAADHPLAADDVVQYLTWCRSLRRAT